MRLGVPALALALLVVPGALTACEADGAGPTPDAATSTGAGSGCHDPDFEPSLEVDTGGAREELLYAHVVSLAPLMSTRGRGLPDASEVATRVRLTEPSQTPLPADLVARIDASLAPYSTQRLPGRIHVPWSVRNRGDTNRSFTVYAAGRVRTGTWTATACGAPVNDGAEVVTLRGRLVAVRRAPGVREAACGIQGSTPVERQAERLACR